MAYGILPSPGTELGPCEGECQHTDCAATRRDAAEVCQFCGEPIGYENKFTRARVVTDLEHDSWSYSHFICELEAIENSR